VDKGPSRVSVVRLVVIVAVGAVLGLLIYLYPSFYAREESFGPLPHLKTGGTSVAFIIMENRWRTKYRKEKGIEVDYEPTGSTEGLTQLIDNHFAIAFTHAPMSSEQKKKAESKGGDVVHIPVVLCAVAPVYNLPTLKDKPPLHFTGEVLADIYLGKIKNWNDPALKMLNEGVELPDMEIEVVHRSDSSGTTLIFSEYLTEASAAWREKYPQPSSEVKWPEGVGVGMARNNGVANHVMTTEGALGYVDLLYAFTGELQHGAVQNKDKTAFIHAAADNMTAAAKNMKGDIPEDLTFKLINRSGKDSYPISGVIWAVCYQTQPAADGKKVVDFLQWVTHEGQQFASNMSYAPLPEELVARVEDKLKSIKVAQ
jgi:phosphate transport system substrate-binding protein